MAGHKGYYRRFRSMDRYTRRESTVTDIACPGCGTVWCLPPSCELRHGTLYANRAMERRRCSGPRLGRPPLPSERGDVWSVAHLRPWCCDWRGRLVDSVFMPE